MTVSVAVTIAGSPGPAVGRDVDLPAGGCSVGFCLTVGKSSPSVLPSLMGKHRRARGYFADDGSATGRVFLVHSHPRVVQMVELDGLKPSGAVHQVEGVLSLSDEHSRPPLELNVRHRMDGLDLMGTLADDVVHDAGDELFEHG